MGNGVRDGIAPAVFSHNCTRRIVVYLHPTANLHLKPYKRKQQNRVKSFS